MSIDTDDEIRRLLDELTTPDHGAGFWDALRDDLHHATGAADAPAQLETARIERGGPSPWLAAAAVVLVLLAGAGIFLSGRDDSVGVVSEPSVVTSPDPEPAEEGALRPDGAASRGSGHVAAVSPDGRWLYTLDSDPAGGTGCEGYPRQRLYVEPADGPVGAQRLPALDESMEAWTTLTFGPEGSVALISWCEGSLTGFRTATIADDGTITAVRPLDLADRFASVVDAVWTSPQRMVVSTYGLGPAQDEQGRGLYAVDASTGEVTPLEGDGAMYLDVTVDGRLVIRDNVGTVRVGDEVLGSEGQVHDLVASADGRFVVTAGAYGVTVYDRDTGRDERIVDTPAFLPSLLPTRDVVFHTRDDEGVGRIVAVHLGDVGGGDHAVATLFSDEGVGRLTSSAVAPDGSRLWITHLDERGEGDPVPVLLGQPLTR